jgi:hypothetical protein
MVVYSLTRLGTQQITTTTWTIAESCLGSARATVDCGVCVSMYRQTGVLAACVECCRPDCWTCATEPLQAMGQASCKLLKLAWPGVHVRAMVCSTGGGGAMFIPVSTELLHVNLTSAQHCSHLPLVLYRRFALAILPIDFLLRQRLDPRAAASISDHLLLLHLSKTAQAT